MVVIVPGGHPVWYGAIVATQTMGSSEYQARTSELRTTWMSRVAKAE
jgi:hypothetical protein